MRTQYDLPCCCIRNIWRWLVGWLVGSVTQIPFYEQRGGFVTLGISRKKHRPRLGLIWSIIYYLNYVKWGHTDVYIEIYI